MGELFFQNGSCIELCTEFHPDETYSSVSAQTASHCWHSSSTVCCGSNLTKLSLYTSYFGLYTGWWEVVQVFQRAPGEIPHFMPRSDPCVSPRTTRSSPGCRGTPLSPVVAETSFVLWLSRLCPALNSEGVENPALTQSWASLAEFQSWLWHTAGHRWKRQKLVGTAVYTSGNKFTIVFHSLLWPFDCHNSLQ